MSIENEIKYWVIFWCESVMIFLILWILVNFYNYLKENKRDLRNK